LPCGDDAISKLIEPLLWDGDIAAAFGRQLPRPDASLFAEHLRLFNYPNTSYVRTLNDKYKYGIRTAFFSNSFAAYRRSALEQIGFFKEGLIFGEDMHAAARLLLAGYKIAYVADAKVYHSHNYTILQDFKRYFDMGVFHKTENWLIKEFGKAGQHGLAYVRSELAFLLRRKRLDLLPGFLVRIAAKYLGYFLGRQYKLLPRRIAKRLSMNPNWWNRRHA